MAKVALGELSVSNITSGYGHKAKAQQPKVAMEDKRIIDVGFEEMFSRNTKPIGSELNGNPKPSNMDTLKAKSQFIEDMGHNSNERTSNTIVDAGYEEFIPRIPKPFFGDSLSANEISDVEIDPWRQYSSSASCFSLQGEKSSINTEIKKPVTDISSSYKPKVFPWDEEKFERDSTNMDYNALFISDIKKNDLQKISGLPSSNVQMRFLSVPVASEGNIFEATLERTTVIPVESNPGWQVKSYEELLDKGKQLTEENQLLQKSLRDAQISANKIHDFVSPTAETATYVPSFFAHKMPSLKKNDSTTETRRATSQILCAGPTLFKHKPTDNSNAYSDVFADSKSVKKNNYSDTLEQEKLNVTKASYSVGEFTKTNDVCPMFDRNKYEARGSKSEHSKLAASSYPVKAWIAKAINGEDRLGMLGGDNTTDELTEKCKTTTDNGLVNVVQKTKATKIVESQPRYSDRLTKTSRVVIVEPEEIRRKRRKTKNEKDRADDLVLNKKGTTKSDHISITKSDTSLEHVELMDTQRYNASKRNSMNVANITKLVKNESKKEYNSKMIEEYKPEIELEKRYVDIGKNQRKQNDATSLITTPPKKTDLINSGFPKTKVDLFLGHGDEMNVQSDKDLCKRCRKELTQQSPRLMTSALTSDICKSYALRDRIMLHDVRPVPSDVYYQLIDIVENLTLTYGAEALTQNRSIEELLNTMYIRTGSTGHDIIDLPDKNGLTFRLYNGIMKGAESKNVENVNVISQIAPDGVPKYSVGHTENPIFCENGKFSNSEPKHDTKEETKEEKKPRKTMKKKIINFFKKLICLRNVD